LTDALPAFPELPAEPPTLEAAGVEPREGVVVRDVRIDAPGRADGVAAGAVEAYLVEPEIVDAGEPRPGLLFAHWFDTNAPNGNRTEYVDEAADWARRRGVTSVLPQLTFPWAADPTDARTDGGRIVAEVTRLRRCLDLLAAQPAVDASRIGVVGHDFGAMHASLLATVDRRPAAYVFVAPVPRWGDWFLPFWEIADDRIDYLRAMRPYDPIEHVANLAPARAQFQFGRRDFFIAPMTGRELARAAGDAAELKAYDAEHEMDDPQIVVDRTEFLEGALGVSAD
jgi:dienelactone hydrolase